MSKSDTTCLESEDVIVQLGDKKRDKACKVFRNCGLHKCNRHILLCVDCEREGCCSKEEMEASWNTLKKELKAKELSVPMGCVHRSRVRCFGLCKSHSGPIAVIYPEGIWYHSVNENVAKRIVEEHIEQGGVIESHVLSEGQLSED